jgi:hypothetical protein
LQGLFEDADSKIFPIAPDIGRSILIDVTDDPIPKRTGIQFFSAATEGSVIQKFLAKIIDFPESKTRGMATDRFGD